VKPHISVLICGFSIALLFFCMAIFNFHKIEPEPIKLEPAISKIEQNNCDFWFKENIRLSNELSELSAKKCESNLPKTLPAKKHK